MCECAVSMLVTTDVNSSWLCAMWTLIDSGCECVCACTVSSVCGCGSLWISECILHINTPPSPYFINPAMFSLVVHMCVWVCLGAWECARVQKCVYVFVRECRRPGCSSDSLFADRNEHAVGLGVQWAETGKEESGREGKKERQERRSTSDTTYLSPWLLPSTAKERKRETEGEREGEGKMGQMKTARLEQYKKWG